MIFNVQLVYMDVHQMNIVQYQCVDAVKMVNVWRVVSLIDVSENKKIGLDFITVQIYAKQVLIVQQEVVVIIKQKMKSVLVLVSVQVICLAVTVSVDINKGIGRI